MDKMIADTPKKDVTYTPMRTTTRLNYRSSCDFVATSIKGVLEDDTTVQVVDDWQDFAHGYVWRKIKIGRKFYFVIADWLTAK